METYKGHLLPIYIVTLLLNSDLAQYIVRSHLVDFVMPWNNATSRFIKNELNTCIIESRLQQNDLSIPKPLSTYTHVDRSFDSICRFCFKTLSLKEQIICLGKKCKDAV